MQVVDVDDAQEALNKITLATHEVYAIHMIPPTEAAPKPRSVIFARQSDGVRRAIVIDSQGGVPLSPSECLPDSEAKKVNEIVAAINKQLPTYKGASHTFASGTSQGVKNEVIRRFMAAGWNVAGSGDEMIVDHPTSSRKKG